MTRIAVTTTLLLLLFVTLTATAQQAGPPAHALLRVPRTIPAGAVAPRARNIVRSRLADVDLGPLGRGRATRDVRTAMDERVSLDFFADVQLHASLHSVTTTVAGGQIFEGDVEGDPQSSVVLSVNGREMFGNVKTAGRWYQIRSAGHGLHAVLEMDDRAMEGSLDPLPGSEENAGIAADSVSAAADDGTTIDVLVMYTPATKASVGGATAVANLINTAVAETNTAYQNSGVTQRLRLVGTGETLNWISGGVTVNADDYTFTDALTMLRNTTDGPMDEVHALRNTYGADEVALLVDTGGSCGVAYVNSTAANAFAVIGWDCATGYYSFAHELGHNMGLSHDRAHATTTSGYAFGWGDPNGAFRTIMAYDPCPNGYSCGRVQYFSNPGILYKGAPTGSPIGTATAAHAAQALNDSASTVANFRASITPACSYSLSPASASLPSAGGSGTVTVTTAAGCQWSASTSSAFVTITSGASGSGSGTVAYSVASNALSSRVGTLTIGGQNFLINQAGAVPTGVDAHATSVNSVLLTWNGVGGATSYQIERRAGGTGFVTVGTTSASPFTDGTAQPGVSYLYRVRVTGASDFSSSDLATTVLFDDDPLLVSSNLVQASHVTQLRTAAAAMRTLAGLAPFAFTDAITIGGACKAVHVSELQTAIDAARTALALPALAYTGGVTTSGTILTSHVQQLRDGVK